MCQFVTTLAAGNVLNLAFSAANAGILEKQVGSMKSPGLGGSASTAGAEAKPDLSEWERTYTWAMRLIGHELPQPLRIVLGCLVLIAVILLILVAISLALAKLKEVWIDTLLPAFYPPSTKQKVRARRQFAEYLQIEVAARNRAENWRDQQYTELEADVEAEGRTRWNWLPWHHRNGVWRAKSFALAIQRSKERLILVEGDPGTGKSVALRHVSAVLARKGVASRSERSILPIYVNLKELRRPACREIDRRLILEFVASTLRRVNDRYVDDFVDLNFEPGMRDGTWLFLFDSFDEIPEVLSAVQADGVVEQYSTAIADFMGGLNRSRGIVASRFYRGPARRAWSTFRILPLSPSRQRMLIQKALINKPEMIPKVDNDLSLASEDVRLMSMNPMLLALLCEHVLNGEDFPTNAYSVFSRYIASRFKRDQERVKARFAMRTDELQDVAEKVAFTMTADPDIGLNPTLKEVEDGLERLSLHVDGEVLSKSFSALSYMRLARTERATSTSDDEQFTFAHRRFQEYFATSTALRDTEQVKASDLLFNSRWRETAVVMLQSGTRESVKPLMLDCHAFIERAAQATKSIEPQTSSVANASVANRPLSGQVLHVLSILQAGSASDITLIPSDLRATIGELLTAAFRTGDLLDRKLALEVAGGANQETLAKLMIDALKSDSQWLSNSVFTQASKLLSPVPEVLSYMQLAMLRLTFSGQLNRDRSTTRAYISRLPSPGSLVSSLNLSAILPVVDPLLVCIVVLAAYARGDDTRLLLVASSCLCYVAFSKLWRITYFSAFGFVGMIGRVLFAETFCIGLLMPHFARGKHHVDLFTTILPALVIKPEKIGWVLAVAWAITWAPSAAFSVRSPRWAKPYFWALPQLSVLDLAIGTLIRRPIRLLLAGLILTVSISVTIGMGLVLARFHLLYLVPLASLVFSLIPVFLLGRAAYFAFRDLLILSKTTQSRRGVLQVNEIVSQFLALESAWGRARYLESVTPHEISNEDGEGAASLLALMTTDVALASLDRSAGGVERVEYLDMSFSALSSLVNAGERVSRLSHLAFVRAQRDSLYRIIERLTKPSNSL